MRLLRDRGPNSMQILRRLFCPSLISSTPSLSTHSVSTNRSGGVAELWEEAAAAVSASGCGGRRRRRRRRRAVEGRRRQEATPAGRGGGEVSVEGVGGGGGAALAGILERVTKRNDAAAVTTALAELTAASAFQATTKPGTSIRTYAARIAWFDGCSSACYAVAYIYLDRLLSHDWRLAVSHSPSTSTACTGSSSPPCSTGLPRQVYG
uniref:Uncharacterized protein n=1 Tax=Oryza brachyantha TaxID=4533 RepID=J3M302_ORYBR